MVQDPKVVPIKPMASQQAPAPTATSALPYPMQGVRKRALGFFKISLSRLFDNTDDSLFELADKAASNAEQNLFFDTLRTLRLARDKVVRECCEALAQRLEQLNQPVTSDEFSAIHLDTLSLVQPDELEQAVAVEAMVKRVAERNTEPLSQLATRINSLVKRQVEADDNPLAPQALADIFVEAIAPLELEIRARLIMFKLFERYVFNPVDELYQQANELLAEAGVLPDLGARAIRRAAVRQGTEQAGLRGQASGASTNTAGFEAGLADQQVLGLFSNLLSKWREASGDSAMSLLGSAAVRPIASDELLEVLAGLPADFEVPPGQAAAALRRRIQQHLAEQQQRTGRKHGLERSDDDVISLVSMLFDFILDDAQLPSALKALVARMQLPILRVAIADKAMFSHSGHPARRLLNELARAAMGWNDQDDMARDQLYALLERQVQRLLDDVHPSPALFEELYLELSERVQQDQQRAERVEQRTRDSEEGRARLEAARAAVAETINALLLGKTLPVFVVDLLRNGWSQVMQVAWLREGVDSDTWRSVCQIAQRLLDSVAPLEGDVEQRRQLNARLLAAMGKGFDGIRMDSAERQRMLDGLAQLQQMLLEHAEQERQRLAQLLAEDPLAESPLQAEPERLPEQITVAEPVLEVPGAVSEPETIEDLPSAAAQYWLSGLRAGSWFELSLQADDPVIRCKLAAIISFTGKHVFVNRTGIKVAEFLREDLARHFDQGLIRQLDDNLLFDRALQSVIGNLRSLHERRE